MKNRIYRLLSRWCSRLPWWPEPEIAFMFPSEPAQAAHQRLYLRNHVASGWWVSTRTALALADEKYSEGRCDDRAAFLQYLRLPADFGGTPHEAVLAARSRDRRRIAALEARVEELEGVLLDAQAARAAQKQPVVG